ncbi:MAG: hypothetical protein AAFO74_01410 [Pseudomonadota bacterium]
MWRNGLILLGGLSGLPALAAPWTQDPGHLYARISIADEYVEGVRGTRADAYAEFGLTELWTATAKAEAVSYREASDFDTNGWRATLRRKLFRTDHVTVSAEFGALQGAAIGGRNGCDRLGGEARAGAAWSSTWRAAPTFVFAEIAGRFHENCQRTRYEFGFGRQTSDKVWSITQVWIERGDTNAPSDKVQSELLWRGENADYSIGYRNENGGAFEEQSVFIALARQF